MGGLVGFVASHLSSVVASVGGAAAAFVVGKVLGPKVLARFITTKSRAQLLEDAAEAVANFLRPAILATPTKYDDIGLALLDAIADWADKQKVSLNDTETATVHRMARLKLANTIANAAALSGIPK